MKKLKKIAPIEALAVAKKFLIENFNYDDYLMHDSRITEEMYRLIYKAKDFYGRDVEIAVTIDFLYQTITADIVLHKSKLSLYL